MYKIVLLLMMLIRCIFTIVFRLEFGKSSYNYDDVQKRRKEKRYSSNFLGKLFLKFYYILTLFSITFIALHCEYNVIGFCILLCVSLLMFPLDFILLGVTYIELSKEKNNLVINFLFFKRKYPFSELRYKKKKVFLSLYHNDKKILIVIERFMEVNFEYFCIKKKQ